MGAHRDDRRPPRDPGVDGRRAAEDRLLGDRAVVAGGEVHRVGEQSGVRLDREPGRELLAFGRARQQDEGRRLLLDELGEQRGRRRDDVVVEGRVGGDIDAGRAELRTALPPFLGPRPGPHHGGLAEPAGQRDQLVGDLLHLAVRVLREHKDLSHAAFPPQMNFCAARNSAALTPPSPSSLTTMPASRGGLCAKLTTSVAAAPRPTWAGSSPASATLSTSTGFFLAAMIPLNDGYRGSLIFSTTLTTAGRLASTLS